MSNLWIKNSLLNRTQLSGFIIISLVIHFLVVIVQMTMPVREEKIKGPPPIQVKYIPAKKKQADKVARIIDAPNPPKKTEKARSKDLLAKFDSRAHSNTQNNPSKKYQQKKTVVPKAKGSVKKTARPSTQKKKIARKPKNLTSMQPRKKPLPESKTGRFKTVTKDNARASLDKPKARIGSALALLHGLDAEKLASLDTGALENTDDDEIVSLDTTEVKYASYFARIKHQIEQAWIYPSDAAQRGISGDLNLTFTISKDGNLLGAQLINSAGYEILDMAALKAVKEAAPFYPFPANIQRNKLSIQANFVYTPNFRPITR
ncbi:MAG: TonB family protein [Nitrospinaceae bacterium]|nr:TonB family protein [Nitrospinaceae bacterium]